MAEAGESDIAVVLGIFEQTQPNAARLYHVLCGVDPCGVPVEWVGVGLGVSSDDEMRAVREVAGGVGWCAKVRGVLTASPEMRRDLWASLSTREKLRWLGEAEEFLNEVDASMGGEQGSLLEKHREAVRQRREECPSD